MVITADILARLSPGADRLLISAIAPVLNTMGPQNGVNTLLRWAHFLGQTCHETDHFRRLEENLDYSASRIAQVWPRLAARADTLAHNPQKLANAAYGGRYGNGPEATGDGWKYRGRGLIQITFRDNYDHIGAIIGSDLVNNPCSAAEPADSACKVALAFWNTVGCNAAADRDDCAGVTTLIAGPALTGFDDRKRLTDLAKTILS